MKIAPRARNSSSSAFQGRLASLGRALLARGLDLRAAIPAIAVRRAAARCAPDRFSGAKISDLHVGDRAGEGDVALAADAHDDGRAGGTNRERVAADLAVNVIRSADDEHTRVVANGGELAAGDIP